ncbi:MAG TPA: NfeD family protein [Pseudogulbenkiania sp.]|nr:NfeD family protein [Pseudogulbenkiania sp.]
MLMTSTFWFSCAVAALIAEFVTGTFYLLVVSLALVGGGLAALSGLSTVTELATASLTGVIGLWLVTRWKKRHANLRQPRRDPDFGQPVRIVSLADNGLARVHYRGTEWDAELLDKSLASGQTGYIVGSDGGRLKISSTPPGQH